LPWERRHLAGPSFATKVLAGSRRSQKVLWREAHLRDPDGNMLCLFYAGKNRLDPPWRLKD
jgi:hypothetical protein